VKVEEGMCDGRVLFHAHVEKSDAERAALQERKETAVQLKDARRKQQVRHMSHGAGLRNGFDGSDQSSSASVRSMTGPCQMAAKHSLQARVHAAHGI